MLTNYAKRCIKTKYINSQTHIIKVIVIIPVLIAIHGKKIKNVQRHAAQIL